MRHAAFVVLVVFAIVILPGCSGPRGVAERPGQHPATFERSVTKTFAGDYLVYLPGDYADAREPWPLLLFLHGAGERGTDLDLVKTHGPPKLVAAGADFPFVIISPQVAPERWWDEDYLDALLDEALARYRIDPSRVYVTGLSMGGFGTWTFAAAHPERIAAIVPICGGGNVREACRLKDVPVWAFHGAKDEVVPLARSEEMIQALQRCGGDAKLTVYPQAGHDSWTATYDSTAVYDWLLQHRKPSAPR